MRDQEFRGKMPLSFYIIILNSNKGRVLDVGCSVGLFLKPYSKVGWDCYGNDPDKALLIMVKILKLIKGSAAKI